MKTALVLLLMLSLSAPALAQSEPADSSGSPPASSSDGGTTGQSASPLITDILNMDIEQLAKVPVRGQSTQTNLTAPSNQVSGAAAETGEATSTADLMKQAPSVSTRRVTAITFDPRIRGYNSSELNASANGMTQLKTRVDIDALFSQIDPGIINNITIIDGPYTSLYGPGFAFMIADLLPTPRFETPQTHLSTNFVFGSNAQTLYSRDNVLGGGKDWGVCFSYGLRDGNDYRSGGADGFLVPSSYQKWDGMLAVSYDLDQISRIEFDCLRTEMNGVELPGVIYDINNSTNQQYNLIYTIQEDPKGPKQVVLQGWFNDTFYNCNASSDSKQRSFYSGYITESYFPRVDVVNTLGVGDMESMGARFLRTFGNADSPQWTLGADWRCYRQRYQDTEMNSAGENAFDAYFGVPRSQIDDIGALTDLLLPLSDTVSVNIGGRVDRTITYQDTADVIASQDFYLPKYGEPAYTLGMAYVTGKKKLTDESTLRAGVAFAMRNPDLTELYAFEPYMPLYRFGNSYPEGDPWLKPEKNLQLDLGLTHQDKKASYGVRGFWSMIHDYIMPVPWAVMLVPPDSIDSPKVLGRNFRYWQPSQRMDTGTINENADYCQANYGYRNVDEVVMLGGDLFGEYLMTERFSVFGSMSYVYGVNNTPVNILADTGVDVPNSVTVPIGHSDGLPGIYPLNGTVGVRYREPVDDRWCVDFSCRMVRAQDNVAYTVSEIAAPGYTTFAAQGYYRVRKNVRVSLGIENLFNRYYTEPGSLAIIGPDGVPTFTPEPGISVVMGIDARF